MMSFSRIEGVIWIVTFSLKGCHVRNCCFYICHMPCNMLIYYNMGSPFLAHLSHKLKVSYCHHQISVVRRSSCVVNNCFKQHL